MEYFSTSFTARLQLTRKNFEFSLSSLSRDNHIRSLIFGSRITEWDRSIDRYVAQISLPWKITEKHAT